MGKEIGDERWPLLPFILLHCFLLQLPAELGQGSIIVTGHQRWPVLLLGLQPCCKQVLLWNQSDLGRPRLWVSRGGGEVYSFLWSLIFPPTLLGAGRKHQLRQCLVGSYIGPRSGGLLLFLLMLRSSDLLSAKWEAWHITDISLSTTESEFVIVIPKVWSRNSNTMSFHMSYRSRHSCVHFINLFGSDVFIPWIKQTTNTNGER